MVGDEEHVLGPCCPRARMAKIDAAIDLVDILMSNKVKLPIQVEGVAGYAHLIHKLRRTEAMTGWRVLGKVCSAVEVAIEKEKGNESGMEP